MKKILIYSTVLLVLIATLTAAFVNDHQVELVDRQVKQSAKDYWFDGTAEISSYALTQARYGELREGSAVLIYVTEPFSKTANTKADRQNDSNIPVLKLNSTKTFNTGIYPYSMMNSTFFPFENGNTSLKMASSIQEWCGMAYIEMKNAGDLVFNLNSYFEGRSFKDKSINSATIEDDVWSHIRLNPELLPTGDRKMIPAMFYLLLKHKPVKAFDASMKVYAGKNGNQNYEIHYPELDRTLTIEFTADFPHQILGWRELYSDGGVEKLTTSATLIKTIKTPYWNQGSNKDSVWRDTLGL